MELTIQSKQNFRTTNQAMQSMEDCLESARFAKDMAISDNEDSGANMTLQDRIELLKVVSSLQKNAVDAAKVVVMNDTLQHRIFHDNRMLE